MDTSLLLFQSSSSGPALLWSETLPAILVASSTSKTASMRLHLLLSEPVCPVQMLKVPLFWSKNQLFLFCFYCRLVCFDIYVVTQPDPTSHSLFFSFPSSDNTPDWFVLTYLLLLNLILPPIVCFFIFPLLTTRRWQKKVKPNPVWTQAPLPSYSRWMLDCSSQKY